MTDIMQQSAEFIDYFTDVHSTFFLKCTRLLTGSFNIRHTSRSHVAKAGERRGEPDKMGFEYHLSN